MGTRIQYNTGDRMSGTRLYFKEDKPSIGKRRRAMFTCDCGNTVELDIGWFKSLDTTSCGCFRSETVAAKNTKHGHGVRTKHTGAYRSWLAMHNRVAMDPRYKDRQVCDRWCGENGFQNFYEDMGDRPEGLTLERMNNNLGYEPSNCKWATRLEQANNTIITEKKHGKAQ